MIDDSSGLWFGALPISPLTDATTRKGKRKTPLISFFICTCPPPPFFKATTRVTFLVLCLYGGKGRVFSMATAVAEACTFDHWQKDVLFSAAEAVQESADRMESVYRIWTRDCANGFEFEGLDKLRRELQTVLGTTKWQLEEFEGAATLSYGNCSLGDGRIARHGQFVAAIQSQIGRVEKSLCDSLMEERKQPLRWVQLDEEERDDLAAFLSAGQGTIAVQGMSDKSSDIVDTRCSDQMDAKFRPESLKDFKETAMISDGTKYVVELEAKDLSETKGKKTLDKHCRTWSSPDIWSWKIAIADNEVNSLKKTLESRTVEPKCVSNLSGLLKNVREPAGSKRSRISFWKEKGGKHLPLKSGISSYLDWKRVSLLTKGRNDTGDRRPDFRQDIETSHVERSCGRASRFKRENQTQASPSLRIVLLLMLFLFLSVPFVFYSN